MGGVANNDTPPFFKKTIDEHFFDLIDCLCNRFMGLSPFEVLNTPTREVYDLYVDCIIHDKREKKGEQNKEVEWVTSKNATWH